MCCLRPQDLLSSERLQLSLSYLPWIVLPRSEQCRGSWILSVQQTFCRVLVVDGCHLMLEVSVCFEKVIHC